MERLVDFECNIFIRVRNFIDYVLQWKKRILEKEIEMEGIKKRRFN